MPLGVRDVMLIFRARDEMSRQLGQMGGAFGLLGGKLDTVEKKMTAAGLASLAVGAGLTSMGLAGLAFFGGMAMAAAEYNQEAALTLTQTDGLETSIGQLADVGRRVAAEIPAPFEQMQGSLFDIFSSMDVNVEQSEQLLTGFSKAAVAGQTDLESAGRATIAIMNAWGLETEDLNHVLDVQFQLVRKGVGTYDEFASTIGRAIPAAARAGQSVETLAAMLAFLTRQGLSTSMAATSAARALEVMVHPKVIDRLKDMGVAVADSNGEFRPMIDILRDLNVQFAGLTDEQRVQKFQDIFQGAGNSIQARRFFDLVFQNFDEFQQRVDEMGGSAGAMEEAYNIMFEQPQSQMQLLINNWEILRTELGEEVLPILVRLVDIGLDLVRWFRDLDPETKKLIVQIGLVSSVLATVLGVITLVTGGLLLLSAAASAAGISWGTFITVMGGVTGGFAALLAIGYLVIDNWETIGPIVKGVTDFFVENKEIVAALAALYVTTLIPQIWAAVTAFLSLKVIQLQQWFFSVVEGIQDFIRNISAGQVALAVFIYSVLALVKAYKDAENAARDTVNELTKDLKTNSIDDMSEAVNRLAQNHQELSDKYRASSGIIESVGGSLVDVLIPMTDVKDSAFDLAIALGVSEDEMERYIMATENAKLAFADLAKELLGFKGQTNNTIPPEMLSRINELALALPKVAEGVDGIDFTMPVDVWLPKLREHIQGLGPDAEAALAKVEQIANEADMGEWATEVQKNTQKAADSFFQFSEDAKAHLDNFENELRLKALALINWNDNLVIIAERGGAGFAAELQKLGPEYAGVIDELAHATDTDFKDFTEAWGQYAGQGTRAMAEEFTEAEKRGKEAVEFFNKLKPEAEEAASALGEGIAQGYGEGIAELDPITQARLFSLGQLIQNDRDVRQAATFFGTDISKLFGENVDFMSSTDPAIVAVRDVLLNDPDVRAAASELGIDLTEYLKNSINFLSSLNPQIDAARIKLLTDPAVRQAAATLGIDLSRTLGDWTNFVNSTDPAIIALKMFINSHADSRDPNAVAYAAVVLGKAIMQGAARGVNEDASVLNTATANAALHAVFEAHKAIEGGSPSRLAQRVIGLPIAQGIAAGINQGMPLIEDAIGNIQAQVTGANIPSPVVTGTGGGAGSSVVIQTGAFQMTIEAADNPEDTARMVQDKLQEFIDSLAHELEIR